MIYSGGECPVCGDFSRLIFGRNRRSQKIFVFCPACDIAGDNPKDADKRLDDMNSIQSCLKLAPDGVDLPSKQDIVAAGLDRFIEAEYAEGEWWIDLSKFTRETR